jgi:alcohol dehydrogenase
VLSNSFGFGGQNASLVMTLEPALETVANPLTIWNAFGRRKTCYARLQLIDDRKLEAVDIPEPAAPGPARSRFVSRPWRSITSTSGAGAAWRSPSARCRSPVGAEASGVVEAQSVLASPTSCPASSSRSTARAPVGCCKPCREGRDNLCEHVSGVHGFHLDGFAQEKTTCRHACSFRRRPGVDAVGAALAPVTFGTVEHMLFDNAKLEPGETILVHAGGSGIGTAAIQLAKKTGCTVITTVGSDDKIERAKALGADHVINYRTDRFEGVVAQADEEKGRRRRLRTCRR